MYVCIHIHTYEPEELQQIKMKVIELEGDNVMLRGQLAGMIYIYIYTYTHTYTNTFRGTFGAT
jgi:hypothetical protein